MAIGNLTDGTYDNLDIKKSIIKLFNSKEYHELKLYYDFKGIFDILGIMRNENVHSNFLSWILNQKQHHGLSNYPIRKFLEMLVITLSDCKYAEDKENLFPEYLVDYIITGNYEVVDMEIEREKVIDNNKRIDIFIDLTINIDDEEDDINIKIILENKVYSKEHSEQTIEYYRWADRTFKDTSSELVFVYLTPISNMELYDLSTQQCECKEYIQINYQHIVDYILEPCKMQQLPQESISLIENYLRCLSYLSMDECSMKNGGIVMAINERERNLLINFWESNKPLLVAMLNVLKNDEKIDEEERENMDKMINTIYTKSGKDYSKCLFKGRKYSKSRVVWAVMNEYINSKDVTFAEIKSTFPDDIQGSSGVLQSVEYINANKDPKRFYMKEEETFVTSDDIEFAVSNQWGKANIDKFIDASRKLGYEITRS